jgi:Sec-independent protein secretion pathway component TatC
MEFIEIFVGSIVIFVMGVLFGFALGQKDNRRIR